jgi:hypothetical protein
MPSTMNGRDPRLTETGRRFGNSAYEFDRLGDGSLTAYRFLSHYDFQLHSPNSRLSEHSLQNEIRIVHR